jgi:hypothetical protein
MEDIMDVLYLIDTGYNNSIYKYFMYKETKIGAILMIQAQASNI